MWSQIENIENNRNIRAEIEELWGVPAGIYPGYQDTPHEEQDTPHEELFPEVQSNDVK